MILLIIPITFTYNPIYAMLSINSFNHMSWISLIIDFLEYKIRNIVLGKLGVDGELTKRCHKLVKCIF
jgi:hypothetical protein